MDTKTREQVGACLEAVTVLADEMGKYMSSAGNRAAFVPIYALLERAEALANGKDEAREKKNAGDRKRRAKSKAPGKKPRKKNPRKSGRHPVTGALPHPE